MMKKIIGLLLVFCSTLVIAAAKPPKLMLQLVVDQLRGDLLSKYQKKFGPDGFNYLLQHGIDYHSAYHSHANTVTCVGHATISTGSYPALHGIISNEWFDRLTGKKINCVEDEQSPILSTKFTPKAGVGRSPRNLIASTLSDEIVLAQKGKAYGVSLKDRSAITLAGHAGKAFWFDRENGGFVSSRYYFITYPQWVNTWNSHYVAKDYQWKLDVPKKTYTFAQAPTFENRFKDFGKTFPHHLGSPGSKTYYKYLSMTPLADEITADFAIALLQNEKLGTANEKTDYLAISFSAVDAIGHQFGPNSLESEDSLLRLDKTIAKLLAIIDQQVGLDNTLIILTADHGVSDASAYLATHNMTETKPLSIPKIKTILKDTLVSHFKLPPSTLQAISLPYIYLNHQILAQHQLSIHEVSAYLTEALREQPGIFQAYTLPLANTEKDWLSAKVDKMAFIQRAGDIYLVPPPYQSLGGKDEQRVSHGTPWQYDSFVPLLFVNSAFKAKHIVRMVNTTDIAPTLTAILSIKPPSAAVGIPLQEVIKQFNSDA
jgi:predicted AlkP superfamily pyrophosphatase or phosphodiesterase